jgi:hypothetical protein
VFCASVRGPLGVCTCLCVFRSVSDCVCVFPSVFFVRFLSLSLSVSFWFCAPLRFISLFPVCSSFFPDAPDPSLLCPSSANRCRPTRSRPFAAAKFVGPWFLRSHWNSVALRGSIMMKLPIYFICTNGSFSIQQQASWAPPPFSNKN